MSKYRNTVFYDFEPRFLFIFSSNYWHRLVLEILFPDHIFPKISKHRMKIFLSRLPANTMPLPLPLTLFFAIKLPARLDFPRFLFLRCYFAI